jgi:hypothetical protein
LRWQGDIPELSPGMRTETNIEDQLPYAASKPSHTIEDRQPGILGYGN